MSTQYNLGYLLMEKKYDVGYNNMYTRNWKSMDGIFDDPEQEKCTEYKGGVKGRGGYVGV